MSGGFTGLAKALTVFSTFLDNEKGLHGNCAPTRRCPQFASPVTSSLVNNPIKVFGHLLGSRVSEGDLA